MHGKRSRKPIAAYGSAATVQEAADQRVLAAIAAHIGVSEEALTLGPERRLQSLWAGYGTVSDIAVSGAGGTYRHSFVVKRVAPPQEDSVSHGRKIRSYEVRGSALMLMLLHARIRVAIHDGICIAMLPSDLEHQHADAQALCPSSSLHRPGGGQLL